MISVVVPGIAVSSIRGSFKNNLSTISFWLFVASPHREPSFEVVNYPQNQWQTYAINVCPSNPELLSTGNLHCVQSTQALPYSHRKATHVVVSKLTLLVDIFPNRFRVPPTFEG